MTQPIPLLALLAAVLATPLAHADALATPARVTNTTPDTDRLLWNDIPVAFTLPVGTESVLRLPSACEVGIPPELTGKLRVEGVKNVLLLKATEAFPSARLALRSIVGNHVYLLDISARTNARTIPRASWAYHRHFVTAVELGNLTPDARELDPRLLRGAWLTATFQHSVIAPQGRDGALTMVYLVSVRPFGDTL